MSKPMITRFRFLALFLSFLFFTKIHSQVVPQTFTTNIPVPIPAVGVVTSDIAVNGIGQIDGFCTQLVSVNINITHTWDGDLCIFLQAPTGQIIDLSTGNGGAGDNYINTTFMDNAPAPIVTGTAPFTGTYGPEGRANSAVPPNPFGIPFGVYSLSSFSQGLSADGTWKLYVNDYVGADFGTINNWSITFGTFGNFVIDAGPNQTICAGQSATLTATGGSTYLWSNGSTDETTTVTPSSTTVYEVTATNGGSCVATDKVTVTVGGGALPTDAGPNKTICAGQTTSLTATGGSSYLWSNGGTTATINVSPSSTTVYEVTATNGGGCSGTDKVTVTVGAPPSVTPVNNVTVCNGNQATLLIPPGFTYLWQTGQTISSINVSPSISTSYVVTVSNSVCSVPVTFNVAVNTPQITPIADISVCGQTATTLTATGGGTYAWSNGSTNPTINVNPSFTTTYVVTVTNSGGCSISDDVKITVNPPPAANAGLDKNICIGKSITLTASGGGTYNWSNGASSSTNLVSPTSTTNYSVTVTSAAGCSSVDDVNVSVNPLPTATISPDISICSGQNANLSASGGTNYAWSSGQNTSNINVNPSSTTTYTVTVSDGNTCTATAQTTVNVNSTNANAGVDVTICSGQNANLVATSSNTNATFTWNNGVNSAANPVSPTATTTYTVTIIDSVTGCTKTDDVAVNIQAPPTANAGADVTICVGQNTNLQASGGSNFTWSNGGSGATNSVFPTVNTTYIVTVSNGLCSTTDQVEVFVNPAPIAVLTAPNFLCSGQATLSVISGFASYNWNNSQNTNSINVTQSGIYIVTVTDANGCKTTQQAAISAPPKPTISAPPSICPNATVSISVNGNYNNYVWSNGQNGKNITISQAGSYTVTVTDGQNCTLSESVLITNSSAPNLTVSGTLGICPNGNTTLNAVSQNVSFLWSNGSTFASLNVNNTGKYSVTATNTNGCKTASEVDVVQYQNPSVKIQGANTICANGGSNTLTLNGIFANYAWSNNASSAQITATASGNYSVTVTDANACKASDQFFISPQTVTPQITGSTSFCPGSSTTLSASASNSASYLWSNGAATATTTANSAGKISVTVTDNIGCKGITSVDISLSSNLNPSILGKNTVCEGNETTFDVGAGFTNYLWSNGAKTQSIKALQSGTYSVTVSDGACSGTAKVDLNVVKNNIKIASVGDTLICPNATTDLEIGNTFSSYIWSNNNGTNAVKNIPAGKYTVTVSDNFGCVLAKNIEVKTSTNPTPKIVGATSFCLGSFTILKTGKYEKYAWSNNSKDSTITVNQAGQYNLSVTDTEGCEGNTFVNVTETNGLLPAINGKNTICKNEKVTLQTDSYKTYLWSDGTTFNAIIVDKSGTYKVSVTDPSGCKGENSFTIDAKTITKPKIVGDTAFCEGISTILKINNATYKTYLWNNGENKQDISVSKSGIYAVTVNDGFCSEADTFSVNVIKNTLDATILGNTDFCFGKNTTLTNTNLNTINYTWNNGKNTISGTDKTSVTSNTSENWTLTITDKYGCSASSQVTTKEIPLPKPSIKGDTIIVNSVANVLDAGAGFATYLWLNGKETQIISVTEPGTYSVTVTNINDCEGVATIVLKELSFIKPDIFGNDKICKNEKAKLEVEGVFDTYLWSNGATTSSIETDKGGFYFVTVSKGNLIGKDTFEVKSSNISADLKTADYNGFGVSCEGKSDGKIILENLKGEVAPVSILWSNGATDFNTSNLKSGIYEVKIKDAFGCEWTKNATITAPKKFDFALTSTPPNCKAENSGEIILTKTENAFFPLKININGQITNALNTPFSIKNISGGDYKIEISDANNCEATQNINVEKQIIPTVDLGEDIAIFAGDEVQLDAKTNINPTQIIWTKINDLSCIACLNPIVKPSASGDYEISVKDALGCQASDRMTISINKDLFIPTAFSPNGDNQNDVFTIFGSKSIKEIEGFEIQDRWGNIVYQGGGTAANWDGNFRDAAAQTGVYIYLATVVFKDNTKRVVKGDVTLYR